MQNSTRVAQNISFEKNKSNNSAEEHNESQIQNYVKEICSNERIIHAQKKIVQDLENEYKDVCNMIYGIFKLLKIDQSNMERLGINEPPNEKNITNYFKEMEKKSFEILYKINCIEDSCITGQFDNSLTSDGESTQNLISKDYDGIEVKTHRVLDVEDPSTLPIPTQNLDTGFISSPCPQ